MMSTPEGTPLVGEQIDTLDHIVEAIDVEQLGWESLGRLAEVNERLIRKWRDGIVHAVKSGS